MNEHQLPWRRNNEILDSLITFPAAYQQKNINVFNEKLTNGFLFLQYDVANLIFSLKYRQRKIDLNTSEKSLHLVTIRPSCTKVFYLRNDTHLWKNAAFLDFHLKESSENLIFLRNGHIQKLMKKSPLLSFSQIFVRRKFFFLCSVTALYNVLLKKETS